VDWKHGREHAPDRGADAIGVNRRPHAWLGQDAVWHFVAPKSRDAAAGVRLPPAIVRRIESDGTIVDLIREIFRRWFEMVHEDLGTTGSTLAFPHALAVAGIVCDMR